MAEELHDLAPFYVLDALDEADRVRFEAHLAGCARCRAEVAELSETLAHMDIEPADSIPNHEPPTQQEPAPRPGSGAVVDDDPGTSAASPQAVGRVAAQGVVTGGNRDSRLAKRLSVWLTWAAVIAAVAVAVLILVNR